MNPRVSTNLIRMVSVILGAALVSSAAPAAVVWGRVYDQTTNHCRVHPLAPDCSNACQVHPSAPGCAMSCVDDPGSEGCARFCTMHPLDPNCADPR